MNGFGKLYAKPIDVSFNTPPSSFHTDGLFDAQKLWKKSCYSTNVTLLLRPKAETNGNNSLAMPNLMIDL